MRKYARDYSPESDQLHQPQPFEQDQYSEEQFESVHRSSESENEASKSGELSVDEEGRMQNKE